MLGSFVITNEEEMAFSKPIPTDPKLTALFVGEDPDAEYWYRYHDAANMAEYEPGINLHAYRVHHRTPRGVQLVMRGGTGPELKFVSNYARKRFAYPTREEALMSFLARKTKQAKILSAQYARAAFLRDLADNMIDEGQYDVPESVSKYPLFMAKG